MSYRQWLMLICAVLIAAWLGRVYAQFARPLATATAAKTVDLVGATAESELPREVPVAPSVTAPSAEVVRAAEAIPTLGFDALAYLGQLPEVLDALTQRAKANDPAALAQLADWVEHCVNAERYQLRTLREPQWRAPGAFSVPEIHEYIMQLGGVCSAWISRHPWLQAMQQSATQAQEERNARGRAGLPNSGPSPTLANHLRARATELGDAAAPPEVPESKACEFGAGRSACVHQWRLQIVRRALDSRDPRAIAAIPNQLMGSMEPYTNAEFLTGDPRAVEQLWYLAACAVGMECGPTGPVLRTLCLQGICGYLHYRDYIADRILPPVHMRRVDYSLPRLVALIRAGDAAGILGPPPQMR